MSAPAAVQGRAVDRRAWWGTAPGATFVKVCGITRLGDAHAAVAAGANALGFVFASSPRQVTPAQAQEISAGCHPGIACFGVFVDASVSWMLDVVAQAGLDAVQLQGGETPAVIDRLHEGRPGLFVARAIRVLDAGCLVEAGRSPADAVMVDSKDPADPGAHTGLVPAAWLQAWPAEARPERLIIAGGLTPGNVGGVVRSLRPWGVDVSAGVEESPGIKDVAKLADFIAAVRTADGPDPAERP